MNETYNVYDSDGISDEEDNCPEVANSDRAHNSETGERPNSDSEIGAEICGGRSKSNL